MELIFKPVTEADFPAMMKIYADAIETNLCTLVRKCPDWADFDADHRTDCRIAAYEGEKLVGWAVLTPSFARGVYSGVAELTIYVDYGCHGRGIGKKLMAEMERQAKEAGVWTIESLIFSNNLQSIGFHNACGWREVGYRERFGLDREGVWRNVTLMEKRL